MSNAPIGVFDSGLGGLTVWSELYKRLPHESLIYYGDGKNCPYGDKSRDEIIGYVDFAVKRLLERGTKMIVVACNAATAMAIDYLRSTYDIPFVGLEPAVKPAAEKTRTGVIGILATAATLQGRLFKGTSAKYADKVEIIARVGEGFVELVENNMENTPEAVETVRKAISPMLDKGADQIVLGCTHYPFLQNALSIVIGDRKVELLNPAMAIEKRAETLLSQFHIAASADNKTYYEFMTSADETYRQKLIDKSKSLNL